MFHGHPGGVLYSLRNSFNDGITQNKKGTQMKTMKQPTRISLAYCPNSSNAILFKPGDFAVEEFERKHGFAMTVGSCFRKYPDTKEGVGYYWMIHFHHAVVRYGVDPKALHQVLCQIPEYRNLCAGDIPDLDEYAEEDNREYGILCMD
jgi:hypothetical protein